MLGCWLQDQDMSGQTIAPFDDAGKGIPADHTTEDTWKVRLAANFLLLVA